MILLHNPTLLGHSMKRYDMQNVCSWETKLFLLTSNYPLMIVYCTGREVQIYDPLGTLLKLSSDCAWISDLSYLAKRRLVTKTKGQLHYWERGLHKNDIGGPLRTVSFETETSLTTCCKTRFSHNWFKPKQH